MEIIDSFGNYECPYCGSNDTNMRVGDMGLCDCCNRIFVGVEEITIFRSRVINCELTDEVSEAKNVGDILRDHGYVVKNGG